MNDIKRTYQIAGILAIVTPILGQFFFSMLIATFEYPDILRKDPAYIMEKYVNGGLTLRLYWFGFALSLALIIPLSIYLHFILSEKQGQNDALLTVSTTFGVIAGATNVLGLIRWPFMVHDLATEYMRSSTTDTRKEAIEVTFSSLNNYAGVGIGEVIGYISIGVWLLLIAIKFQQMRFIPTWVNICLIASSIGFFVGPLEFFGWGTAGVIVAIFSSVAFALLAIVGIFLIYKTKQMQ